MSASDPVAGEAARRTRAERALALAAAIGLAIAPEDLDEVAARLDCLLVEAERWSALDLAGIEPLAVFPDPGAPPA